MMSILNWQAEIGKQQKLQLHRQLEKLKESLFDKHRTLERVYAILHAYLQAVIRGL